MKSIYKFAVALILAFPGFVSAQIAGKTLGIPDGEYHGIGAMIFVPTLAPVFKFKSSRSLHQGIINATTDAFYFGDRSVSVSARLQIVPTQTANQFDILDLDQNSKKVGRATCQEKSCSFQATIKNGLFTLIETWVPNGNGFDVIDGYQMIAGTNSIYQAVFQK